MYALSNWFEPDETGLRTPAFWKGPGSTKNIVHTNGYMWLEMGCQNL